MKKDVIKRIIQTIRNKKLRDRLIQKIKNNEDLSLSESKMVYGPVEFGQDLPMTKKRILDIDWTDHAEYRSELRDIQPEKMNDTIRDKVRERFLKKPKSKAKERFKSPHGTAVVDFNTSNNPAEADVVTTWASTKGENSMHFASKQEAFQHLANITGKAIRIAAQFNPHPAIKSPKEVERETNEFASETIKKEGGKAQDVFPIIAGMLQSKYELLYEDYQKLLKEYNKLYEESN